MATSFLEARSSVMNGCGNGALQKIGATREALLRKSFLKDSTYHDQVLWGLSAADWLRSFGPSRPQVH